MRLCRKMLRERQLCGGPYHRLCMLRVSCSSAAATTRKKSPPQPCRSQTDAERLRKFSKALAWFWMVFTPGRAAFEFIQDFGSGFHTCFSSKLIPQVFHQLKAFKPAKLCNGLQCWFHIAKSSTCLKQIKPLPGRKPGPASGASAHPARWPRWPRCARAWCRSSHPRC